MYENPINMADPTGNIAWWIIGAGIGAIVGGIAGAVYSSDNRGAGSWIGHKLRVFPDGTRVRIRVGE